MTVRLTPTPRSEALGAVQMRQAGDAGNDAITASEYTTSRPLDTAQHLCDLLVTELLDGTLLDPHASPVIACAECCLPLPLCGCQGQESVA